MLTLKFVDQDMEIVVAVNSYEKTKRDDGGWNILVTSPFEKEYVVEGGITLYVENAAGKTIDRVRARV